MRGRRVGDEELAALGVFASRGQAHAAFLVAQVAEFGAQVIGGAAVAVAARVAALSDKVGHHAVEEQVIVEMLADERDKARHRTGRFVGLQFQQNYAFGRAQPHLLA